MSVRLRLLFSFFTFFVLYIFNSSTVLASKIILQSDTTDINSFDEYTANIALSLNVADNTESYLRGVFYKQNGRYCGYTWNGTDWFNGPYGTNEGWKNLLKITINNASWSGTLKAKIDTDDGNCSDSGTYNFKIIRYTGSGNAGSDDENPLTVNYTAPIPTSRPSPVPTDTPIPSTSADIPSSTPTPKFPTPTRTPNATKMPSPNNVLRSTDPPPSKIATQSAPPTSILGVSTNPAKASFSGTSAQPPKQKFKTKTLIESASETKLPFLIISVTGAILLVACAILIALKIKKSKSI